MTAREAAYLVYSILLVLFLVWSVWRRLRGIPAHGNSGTGIVVTRAAESMTAIDGMFAGATAIHLGVSAVAVTPESFGGYAFLIAIIDEAALGYLFYLDGRFRNWAIGLRNRTSVDR